MIIEAAFEPSPRGQPSARAGQKCRGLVALTLFVAVLTSVGREAQACSPPNPALGPKPTAIPRDGAVDVPTGTSFVVVSTGQPVDVALDAAGVAVPIAPPLALGGGQDGATGFGVTFWQVKAASGFLPASSDVTLSIADGKGGRLVLSKVHTAAGYDKQRGSAAALKSLTLTRVRYPLSEVNSGDCVFSEYIGYISFESDAAAIPGTPADSVVNVISLSPKNGGAAGQARVYTGDQPYTGTPVGAVTELGAWFPYLDPTLEYCASISSFGYGDVARLPVASNVVCAHVTEVTSPGLLGDAGSADAATDDAASASDGGAQSGADASIDVPPFDDKTTLDKSGSGCAAGGGASASPLALGLLALAWLWSSARRGAAAVSRARRARRS